MDRTRGGAQASDVGSSRSTNSRRPRPLGLRPPRSAAERLRPAALGGVQAHAKASRAPAGERPDDACRSSLGAGVDLQTAGVDPELPELERDLGAEGARRRPDPARSEADEIIAAAPAQPQALPGALLGPRPREPARDVAVAAQASAEDLRAALVVVERH